MADRTDSVMGERARLNQSAFFHPEYPALTQVKSMNLSDIENMTLAELISNEVIIPYFKTGRNYPEELHEYDGKVLHGLCYSCLYATSLEEVQEDPMMIVLGLYDFAVEDEAQYSRMPKVFSSRKAKKGHIYLMKNFRNGYTKIGFTTQKPEFRESTLQSEEPEIGLIWNSAKGFTYDDEKNLHEKYAEFRLRGEWFDLDEKHVLEITTSFGGEG